MVWLNPRLFAWALWKCMLVELKNRRVRVVQGPDLEPEPELVLTSA